MAGKGMEIQGNMIQAEAYFMSNLPEPGDFIYGIHLNPQCIRPTATDSTGTSTQAVIAFCSSPDVTF